RRGTDGFLRRIASTAGTVTARVRPHPLSAPPWSHVAGPPRAHDLPAALPNASGACPRDRSRSGHRGYGTYGTPDEVLAKTGITGRWGRRSWRRVAPRRPHLSRRKDAQDPSDVPPLPGLSTAAPKVTDLLDTVQEAADTRSGPDPTKEPHEHLLAHSPTCCIRHLDNRPGRDHQPDHHRGPVANRRRQRQQGPHRKSQHP